jgi:hypothetical protein
MRKVDLDNQRTGIRSVFPEVQIYGQQSKIRETARLPCACHFIAQRGPHILPCSRLPFVAVVAVHHQLSHITPSNAGCTCTVRVDEYTNISERMAFLLGYATDSKWNVRRFVSRSVAFLSHCREATRHLDLSDGDWMPVSYWVTILQYGNKQISPMIGLKDRPLRWAAAFHGR